mmetsp:Transcript_19259/g.37760  ORF Transcript_19259/g.37760 Transcript_19259/m.37760 type:complete len:95 (+) Transcript_19259:102-386(+)
MIVSRLRSSFLLDHLQFYRCIARQLIVHSFTCNLISLKCCAAPSKLQFVRVLRKLLSPPCEIVATTLRVLSNGKGIISWSFGGIHLPSLRHFMN